MGGDVRGWGEVRRVGHEMRGVKRVGVRGGGKVRGEVRGVEQEPKVYTS